MLTTVPTSTVTERALQIQAAVDTQRSFGAASQKNVEEFALRYNKLLEIQKDSDEEYGPGRQVASDEVWQDAWNEKEEYYRLKNAPKESSSDPSSLLMDKASTLPAGSPERKQVELTKSTIDNTTSGVGSGLDTMTRESYKETKRLMKHSEMLQEGAKQPLPAADQIVGEEEGQVVSNLQSWKPALANAVKPVSDAMGSHADTASSVVKSPMGADQFLPTAAAASVDSVASQFTNEIDTTFKATQMEGMQHMPSKTIGSIRNLSTASDPMLSIPFEVASDVYNGLMGAMNEISNLTDGIMSSMTSFGIGLAGGLVDGIFPASQFKSILGPISKITAQISGINQLLGGFFALTQITQAVGGVVSSLSSVLNNPAKLASMLALGADVASIVGGSAGKSLGCVGSQLNMQKTATKIANIAIAVGSIGGVLGSLNNLGKGFGSAGKGLGNLGAILGKGIPKNIGKQTKCLRHPEQIINGVLPPELSQALQGLDKLCTPGMVGNMGYSVGNNMDFLRDSSFSKCMNNYAAHASIVGPLFNKDVKKTGSYAQDASLDMFVDSKFVKGAQGNKGVTMLGPGATADQKVFGRV